MAFGTRLRRFGNSSYTRRRSAYKRAYRVSKPVRTYVSRALQVRGLSRPEVKNFFYSDNIPVSTALNIGGLPLGPQVQGPQSDQFQGSSYRAHDLEMSLHVYHTGSTTQAMIRVMVVCDTNSGTQQLELYDTTNAYNNLVLQANDNSALVNRYRPSRFYVLKDDIFHLMPFAGAGSGIATPTGVALNSYKSMRHYKFNLRNAEVSTVPGLTSGTWTMRRQYLLFVVSDTANVGMRFFTRMGFTDV